MFNLSKNVEIEKVIDEVHTTKDRFFVFLQKLEIRLKEFAEEALPELTDLNKNDPDGNKLGFYRMKSSVEGQLDSIVQKARDVFEEKKNYFEGKIEHEHRSLYYDFRNQCLDGLQKLEITRNYYKNQIEGTDSQDYEMVYQAILEEYDSIKNNFNCVQCSSPILIDKIYFTTTYLSCAACFTQNTFEPSSQTKQLEHVGRSLAEQRTAHLLQEYKEQSKLASVIFSKKHELEMSLAGENLKDVIVQKTKIIQELTAQNEAVEKELPILYERYLRTLFDHWNAINPTMKNEHEKFYTRLLKENYYI
ncbi:hypothetical protein [Flavobacterium muglaense]|uniref:Uncharacterized protein n=1 Tax=Flavobacterium muglaense TaxID=2764716 RepID=A0A923MW45_9FLAO|nr:hypothetical protein [Flavobacterium muglaense]MBC5836834.1 hypothetical protein [Flavobacterium muglaense]MBC5843363.1 hypothetical protein [Flavobacterium muglaense]